MTIRLVLVEDHPIVIDGIRAALSSRPGMSLVGQAVSIAEARALLTRLSCDVVLLDLRLPDGSGIDLLRDAGQDPAGPAFLVLSSFLTTEYVSASIALGAGGFLLKTSPVGDIVAAIETIAAGGLAFTPDQLRSSRNAAWAPLTPQQHAVLDGIVRGRSNDELAGDLGLSRKTIESYITRLLARFGAMTRTELAVAVERGQILDLPQKRSGRRRA